jgi:hypothetical protein
MERILQEFTSPEEADKADREAYKRMTPEQRLMMALQIRRDYLGEGDATEQRLERVLTRAQLPRPGICYRR